MRPGNFTRIEYQAGYYNVDFIRNIQDMMGRYQEHIFQGRRSYFEAINVFEIIVLKCMAGNKIDLPKDKVKRFFALLYADSDYKQKKGDIVPLYRLQRYFKEYQNALMMNSQIGIEASQFEIFAAGYLNEKDEVTEKFTPYFYSMLLDRVLRELLPIMIELEVEIQNKICGIKSEDYEEEETRTDPFYQNGLKDNE